MDATDSNKIATHPISESECTNDGFEKSKFFLENDIGLIEIFRIQCPSGINVSQTTLKFNSHADKSSYQNVARIESEELSLFIQIIKKGIAKVQEITSQNTSTISSGNAYFCTTQKTDILYEFSKKEDVEIITLTYPISFCEKLFGRIYFTNFIHNLQNACEIEKNLPISKGINVPLSEDSFQTIENKFNLNLNLRIQQSAIDFLMTLTEVYSDNRKKQDKLDSRSIAWIVHSELKEMNGKIISYSQIQDRFGTSAKIINAEFLQIFGITISKFAQKIRFEEAARLLRETSTPPKIISNMLGYSNVNNFIMAFKKEFHQSPVRYRKINRISVRPNNI